ncbi:hypothetical protein KUW17_07790 [Leisingera aquaemixtae]|uniref:hypothetical protein n=1 Tax=Leisingera aquaemixtae TaxID=1396826 RepID=UPI001C985D45|nr:hypothetical protein [Leisingera aquaemixtae]MBY6066636.1 hypothetical protein [Leisingera aquaemixtae]
MLHSDGLDANLSGSTEDNDSPGLAGLAGLDPVWIGLERGPPELNWSALAG